MRPHDLPPPAHYPHGTRARYVAGCRCAACRASNVRAYHERQARARAAAAELPAVAAQPVPQLWTGPDGQRRERRYARGCPGIHGAPCPWRSHLRRDSGPVCARCRDRLVWNGLIPADRARAHLQQLARAGVGRRAVASTTDIAASILMAIRSGRRRQIRATTERKILAVDRRCVADHALVPAGRAWRQLERLKREGYPAIRLARFLGQTRSTGLQFGRLRMTARTVQRINRLYRELLAIA